MQAEDRVLDLGLLQPRPLRVRLDKRPRGAALSFAVCMQASHRFLGGRLAYRRDVFKIHFARATAMTRNVFGVTGENFFFLFVAAKAPIKSKPPRLKRDRMPATE